jgi:hypothetical protein
MTGRRGTRCCRSTSASSSRSERRPLYLPLIEHWAGGQTWSVVHSPNPGSSENFLTAVAADSASGVWIVGTAESASGFGQGLVLHWDGSRWSKVATPGVVVAVGSPVSFTVSTGKQPNGRPCVVTN